MNIAFHTATSALGAGLKAHRSAISSNSSGLRENDFEGCQLDTWIGRVAGVEETELPEKQAHFESRNNRLAWLALQQDQFLQHLESFKDRLGSDRIAVIIGTSTSSIGRTEQAYRNLTADRLFAPEFRQPVVHNMHSPGLFVASVTGITGPSLTISTACSSSAKVYSTARRWIRRGLVDAALVGGVDSLCLNTLYGFNSLQLVSADPCRPFDRRRNGINLGEAAAYALLTREDIVADSGFRLLGIGESSDAYHMSHPHPEGRGAILAMEGALKMAGLQAGDIDYVNLHGTGTQANDGIEALALAKVLGENQPEGAAGGVAVSSTKGWTGHTLGAAGMIESVLTLEAMQLELAPGTLNCESLDETLGYPVLQQNQPRKIRFALSNSFGFGGSNATLALGLADD